MTLTHTLARFAFQSRLAEIAEPVQDEAVRGLVDWLGCTLGGCLDTALDRALARLDDELHPAKATLPGRGERIDAVSSALITAIAADALDFAAVHAPSGAAVSVPVASALIALAEGRAATGAQVVHAYVLGAEVTCRLAHAAAADPGARSPSLEAACGAIGAALACGKLLRLDEARLAHALEAAAEPALVVTAPAAAGMSVASAARAGLAAALAAEANVAIAPQPLEGRQVLAGLAQATGQHAVLDGLGAQWQLQLIAYKPYPCERALHAAIEACLGLRSRSRLLLRQLASIELRVHPQALVRAGPSAPASVSQARRSFEHAAAAALLDGAAGPEQFDARRLASARVAEMRARISVRADARLMPDSAHVVVRLADGRMIDHGVRCARGSPARPLTDAELSTKFRDLAGDVLASNQVERLLALAWNVRSLNDIGALVRASIPDEEVEPAELPGSPLIPR